MSYSNIFVRAIPKTIRLTERYSYKVVMSNLFQTDPMPNPTGLIEVITPYDGWRYFTRNALKDLLIQTRFLTNNEINSKAQIGHLSLVHHENTNLDQLLPLSIKNNTLPLRIPVMRLSTNSGELNWPYNFYSDKQSAQIIISYIPQLLEYLPLSVDSFVFDEDAMADRWELIEPSHEYENPVIKRISRQISFEGSLIFQFQFFLEIPRERAENIPSLPQLTQMNLDWPVATSYRRVHLRVNGKVHPFIYNPLLSALQWGDISFEPTRMSSSRSIYRYETPLIELHVDEPGELYKQAELTGKAIVEIPCLLSGLQAGYFDVLGVYRPEIKIEHKTIVATDLRLFISDSFEQRSFSPQQQLQFPELILDELRLTDIIMLLKDERFTIHNNPLNKEFLSPKGKHLITASRSEGSETLRLWIVVDGTPSNTTREREIPGGEIFTTSLETGNTTLHIRGQLARDSQRVVNIINQIHNRLKERFRHVRIID